MPRLYKWNHVSEVPADSFEVGIPASGAGPEVVFGSKAVPGTDADPFILADGVAPLGTRNVAVRAVKGSGPTAVKSGWSNQIAQTFALAAPKDFAEIV
jgi:hypothetical protein